MHGGGGRAAPVSARPPVRVLPLRATPRGGLFRVYAPPVCVSPYAQCGGEGAPPRIWARSPTPRLAVPAQTRGGGGGAGCARPLCMQTGAGRKRVRGAYPFPSTRPLVCVSPLRANRGRRGLGAPLPGWRATHRSRVAFACERGMGVQRGGALPIPAWAPIRFRGPLSCAPRSVCTPPRPSVPRKGGREGGGTHAPPVRARTPPGFRTCLVTCGRLCAPVRCTWQAGKGRGT